MTQSQNTLINLNNCDFSNPKARLNSPKSIDACRRLGIDPNELHFIDFHQYKLVNQDILSLPREIQKMRWDQHEARRQAYLIAASELRDKIIEEELSCPNSKVRLFATRKEVNQLRNFQ